MATSALWQRFQEHFLEYTELGFSLDISRMRFHDGFLAEMESSAQKAFVAMRELEAGAISNPDEQRMVGHYWLRNPQLAPNSQLRADVERTNELIRQFAADVHGGTISAASGERFRHVLLIGIGGSALGPQFVGDALASADAPLDLHFLDNTDPDGFDRVFDRLRDELPSTLVVVISKSGGTKETRNGMLEAEARFAAAGVRFGS
ncbi:MAG: glucose-6-phosphate isomerase, partial [Verrucomicrobiota bacterium]|nr:glucose-6-phosphate isomerase [Verrucomicrobiota bacterium]